MKRTRLFLLFVVAVLILPFLIKFGKGYERSIAEKLKALSSDERKCLDLFFRDAFAFDGLGYTLFGDKPMTAAGYSESKGKCRDIDDFFNSTFSSFFAESLRARRGYEILKKHWDHFQIKGFGMVRCKNFIDNDYTIVLFINKKAVLATARKHLADFKGVLGDDITPEILLSKMLVSDDVFGGVLKNHQGLIGTLLGYGRHNAWLFQRREEIDPIVLKMNFSLRPMGRGSQSEINDVNDKLQRFDDRSILDFNPLLLKLPSFCADPQAKETAQLKINYQRQYRKIIQRYRNRDFLEVTLEQMAKNSD